MGHAIPTSQKQSSGGPLGRKRHLLEIQPNLRKRIIVALGNDWCRVITKRLFYQFLGPRRLTDEVLRTTLCLVEQFVNNRPLVPASSDPTDLNDLTPNHFLIGGTSSSFPFEDQGERGTFIYRKRFQQAQAYANVIWTRWLKEYAPTLNVRRKWNVPNASLKKMIWSTKRTPEAITRSSAPKDLRTERTVLSGREQWGLMLVN